MLVLQGAFLAGLHGVAEEHPGAPGAVSGSLHGLRCAELTAPVGEEDVHVLAKEGRGEDRFQEADTGEHGGSRFLLVQERNEQAGLHELEGLDKGAAGFVIVYGIHLGNEPFWVFGKVGAVVLVCTSLEIAPVLPLLVSGGLAPSELPGDLPAQIHDGDASHFVEYIGLNVVVEGLLADPELGMHLKDLVGRKPLAQEWTDDVGHSFCFCRGQVHSGSGVR